MYTRFYCGWKCLERTRWNIFYNIKKVVLFLKLDEILDLCTEEELQVVEIRKKKKICHIVQKNNQKTYPRNISLKQVFISNGIIYSNKESIKSSRNTNICTTMRKIIFFWKEGGKLYCSDSHYSKSSKSFYSASHCSKTGTGKSSKSHNSKPSEKLSQNLHTPPQGIQTHVTCLLVNSSYSSNRFSLKGKKLRKKY